MMPKRRPIKRTNLTFARNHIAKMFTPDPRPTVDDLRRQALVLSYAPPTLALQRERQTD